MMHLAARSPAAYSGQRVEPDETMPATDPLVSMGRSVSMGPLVSDDAVSILRMVRAPGFGPSQAAALAAGTVAGSRPRRDQNFLESGEADFHNILMGAGGDAHRAIKRLPTVDRESRTTLDIRVAASTFSVIEGGRDHVLAHRCRSSTLAFMEQSPLLIAGPLNIR